MSNYIRIQGHPELVKDTNSGAILNIDNEALKMYKIQRANQYIMEKKQKRMEEDISTLKSDMSEIKNLLKELVKR